MEKKKKGKESVMFASRVVIFLVGDKYAVGKRMWLFLHDDDNGRRVDVRGVIRWCNIWIDFRFTYVAWREKLRERD